MVPFGPGRSRSRAGIARQNCRKRLSCASSRFLTSTLPIRLDRHRREPFDNTSAEDPQWTFGNLDGGDVPPSLLLANEIEIGIEIEIEIEGESFIRSLGIR